MKWEIKRKDGPKRGDVRFKTRFAWLPTEVLSKITMTDHIVWLDFYVEEQEYRMVDAWGDLYECEWRTVSKTIHI